MKLSRKEWLLDRHIKPDWFYMLMKLNSSNYTEISVFTVGGRFTLYDENKYCYKYRIIEDATVNTTNGQNLNWEVKVTYAHNYGTPPNFFDVPDNGRLPYVGADWQDNVGYLNVSYDLKTKKISIRNTNSNKELHLKFEINPKWELQLSRLRLAFGKSLNERLCSESLLKSVSYDIIEMIGVNIGASERPLKSGPIKVHAVGGYPMVKGYVLKGGQKKKRKSKRKKRKTRRRKSKRKKHKTKRRKS
jgi:hypothetical protein